MPAAAVETIFLLPERRRFAGQPLSAAFARRLGRGDRVMDAVAGERAQLLRHFELLPRAWPLAAITREFEAGDAGGDAWLRADPVHVRPDLGGARLLAWGNLQLQDSEADALLRELKPLFGDTGFPISRTSGERWYLRLPREAKTPEFAPPSESLGDDLLRHLPEGPDGRRWRSLLNEAQILLHQHPVNARRQERGLPTANSLWFWGAGALPTAVRSIVRRLETDDIELRALAARVEQVEGKGGPVHMVDLRGERQWTRVESAIEATSLPLRLDFSDGVVLRIDASQRWRFWRRPLASLA
jgi:hypothetical protein